MLPSGILSAAVLETTTMVEVCFSPSQSMFIARRWKAVGLSATCGLNEFLGNLHERARETLQKKKTASF